MVLAGQGLAVDAGAQTVGLSLDFTQYGFRFIIIYLMPRVCTNRAALYTHRQTPSQPPMRQVTRQYFVAANYCHCHL